MTALTRRTWAQIETEVLARIGRSTGSSSRAQHWIDAVYRELCLTYHHYELDAIAADQAISSAATSLALPADCYAIFAVLLKSNAGVEIGRLTAEHARFTLGGQSAAAAQPETYARFASTIYFAQPTDAAYQADIYYYKTPTAPDFASGSPAIDRLWDDVIIRAAADVGLRGYWAPEAAVPQAESLKAFLERVVNPPLATGVLIDLPEAQTLNRSHGGAQG